MNSIGFRKCFLAALVGLMAVVQGCTSVQLHQNAQSKFDEYKSQSYPDFKAFAYDRKNKNWGIGYGYRNPEQAMARALRGCGNLSDECEIYALGNTVVIQMSKEQSASAKEAYIAGILGNLDDNMAGNLLSSEALEHMFSGKSVTFKGSFNTGYGFIAVLRSTGTIQIRMFSTKE